MWCEAKAENNWQKHRCLTIVKAEHEFNVPDQAIIGAKNEKAEQSKASSFMFHLRKRRFYNAIFFV